MSSPPPPYHPVNIYIVDGDRDRQRRVVVPSSNSTQDPPTRQDNTGRYLYNYDIICRQSFTGTVSQISGFSNFCILE